MIHYQICLLMIFDFIIIRFTFDAANEVESVSMAGWGLRRDQFCLTKEGGPSPFHPCKVTS